MRGVDLLVRRLRRALTRNEALTHRDHVDPRLRGRTYAIPFDRVWTAALELADGGLRRWTVVEADDIAGIIRAEARTLVFRFVDDVTIRVSLDVDAQTRVDLRSESRKGKADLGANARRIGRFCRKLDRALGAGEGEILVGG